MRLCAIQVHKHCVEAMLLQQCREVTTVILRIMLWLPTYMGQSLIRCNSLGLSIPWIGWNSKHSRSGLRTICRMALSVHSPPPPVHPCTLPSRPIVASTCVSTTVAWTMEWSKTVTGSPSFVTPCCTFRRSSILQNWIWEVPTTSSTSRKGKSGKLLSALSTDCSNHW